MGEGPKKTPKAQLAELLGDCFPAAELRRILLSYEELEDLGKQAKARELLRVATPETEAAWVDRARAVPSRVLEREVTCARVGELPPAGDLPLERRPAWERLVIELDSADRDLFDTMLAMLAAKLGADGEELDRGALVGAAAKLVIARLERDKAGDGAPTGERHRVVIDHCPSCRDNTLRALGGVREVSEAVAAEAARDPKSWTCGRAPRRGTPRAQSQPARAGRCSTGRDGVHTPCVRTG